MKPLLLIITCLSIAFSSTAQIWQQLNLPTTKDIVSSSFVSDDEGWIGFENAAASTTLYHTSDGGNSWAPVSVNGAGSGTSYVCFVSALEGYVVIAGEAFKTIDGGLSWSQFLLPAIPYNEPYFLNEDTGFISGQYAVFKTVDGGITWTSCFMEPTDNKPLYKISFQNDSIGAAVDGGNALAVHLP